MLSIAGYEGRYSITKDGRIWSHIRKKWLKSYLNREGYPSICLTKEKRKRKTNIMHILVAKAFIPNIENKPYVNHKNKIKTDNRVENLEWSIARSNNFGENHYNAKLTWKQVREMRENRINVKWGDKPWKKYRVDKRNYYKIINNTSWKNDPMGDN